MTNSEKLRNNLKVKRICQKNKNFLRHSDQILLQCEYTLSGSQILAWLRFQGYENSGRAQKAPVASPYRRSDSASTDVAGNDDSCYQSLFVCVLL